MKQNQNDFKNYHNNLLELILLNTSNDVNHAIVLRALGWEPLKMERKAKGKMMYKVL